MISAQPLKAGGGRRGANPAAGDWTRQPRTSAMRMLPSPRSLSKAEKEPVSPVGVLTAFADVGAMGEVCRSAGCCMGSRAPRPPPGRPWRPCGPSQRLVHVSGFQNPKTTNMLLGFEKRAVGDEQF